jgi:hypothetical protein
MKTLLDWIKALVGFGAIVAAILFLGRRNPTPEPPLVEDAELDAQQKDLLEKIEKLKDKYKKLKESMDSEVSENWHKE